MAAIIARLTREKRERELRMTKEISISKCNYQLKPFPARFKPSIHNKYLRNRKTLMEKNDLRKKLGDLTQLNYMKKLQESRGRWTFLVEFLIIILSLAFVPFLVMVAWLFWPCQQTDIINAA